MELREMGYQVVAISADRPAELQESLEQHDLGFQLLSDSSMTAAVEFGLAWRMSDPMVEQYLSFGLDLEGASGQDHHLLPVPAVFIVSTEAVVQFRYFNPNHRERLDTGALLSAAKVEMGKKTTD